MIWYTTISSSLPFVEKNPDIVERFLKGLIEGIHFFKTQPEQSIEIIQPALHQGRPAQPRAGHLHLPEPRAASRAEALSDHGGDRRTSTKRPSATTRMPEDSIRWNYGTCIIIRRLDDSGFVDELYGAPRATRTRQEQTRSRISPRAGTQAGGSDRRGKGLWPSGRRELRLPVTLGFGRAQIVLDENIGRRTRSGGLDSAQQRLRADDSISFQGKTVNDDHREPRRRWHRYFRPAHRVASCRSASRQAGRSSFATFRAPRA